MACRSLMGALTVMMCAVVPPTAVAAQNMTRATVEPLTWRVELSQQSGGAARLNWSHVSELAPGTEVSLTRRHHGHDLPRTVAPDRTRGCHPDRSTT
jgi:hypothetical protein